MFIQTLWLLLQCAVWSGWQGEAQHRPHPSTKLEAGQGLVEYAIILVLVGVLVMVMLMVLGPVVSNMFTTITNSMIAAQQ